MMKLDHLQTQAVFVQRPLGVLHISGSTRLDLIDRMSTQKVKGLAPGTGAATIFTTDIGRIIDRVLLYSAKEHLMALTGENYSQAIGRYLMSYVFFGDDFQLVDQTADTAVLALYGQPALTLLNQLGAELPIELPKHHWRTAELAGVAVTLHRTDPVGGDGWFMLLPTADLTAVQNALTKAGAMSIDEETFEGLRIAAGLPRFGAELTQEYIPLEAGLWDDISFNKGCYIGQEIIARMESRGKLAKRLVKLRLEAAAAITAGAELQANGKTAGTITSVSGLQALAYVKTAVLDAQTPLTVGSTQAMVIDSP